jgi:hypothetical protein
LSNSFVISRQFIYSMSIKHSNIAITMAFAVGPIILEFASICSLALSKSENILNENQPSVAENTCNPIT